MKNRIKNLIRRIRGRGTVDGVLSQFTKTIEDLRDLEAEAVAKGWEIEQQMCVLKDQQELADEEADKARKMAKNLEALFR